MCTIVRASLSRVRLSRKGCHGSIGQRGNLQLLCTERCARLADPGQGFGGAAIGRRVPKRVDGPAGRRRHRGSSNDRIPAAQHAGQFRMVAKGEDGRYRSAAALAVLGASFDNNVRQLSVATLRGLADELGTTVSLLVAEGDQQVAIAVIVPTNVFYQLSFHEGSRHPLEREPPGSPCSPACPRAQESATSFPKRDNKVGSSRTARSNRTRTALPCRCGGDRLLRHASTSSPIAKTWSWAAGTQSSRQPTNYPRSSAEGRQP